MPHSASLGSMAAAIFEAVTSGTLEPRAMILAGVMWGNCQESLGCGMGAGMRRRTPTDAGQSINAAARRYRLRFGPQRRLAVLRRAVSQILLGRRAKY